MDLIKQLSGTVGAAVIDENDLEVNLGGVQCGADRGLQVTKVFNLVVDGDDQRYGLLPSRQLTGSWRVHFSAIVAALTGTRRGAVVVVV